jgi:hypothetical protein
MITLCFPTLEPFGEETLYLLIDGLIKFNNLPDIVGVQESISPFKVELKRNLLSKYLKGTL